MNEIIRKRKSIRKFDMTALDKATLDKVKSFIDAAKPLFPGITCSISFAEKTKGMFNVKAPHYLIFKSETADGSNENIGFIGQQADLFLSESGLGSCWLGLAKQADGRKSGLPHVISMAFGKPAEPLHRSLAEFRRKPLSAISEGTDSRIEAARLAPSGMNRQNWFFAAAEDGQIHCYRKKPDIISGLFFDKLEAIDAGIAICHIAAESENFSFAKMAVVPERKGLIYVGTAAKS